MFKRTNLNPFRGAVVMYPINLINSSGANFSSYQTCAIFQNFENVNGIFGQIVFMFSIFENNIILENNN